MSDPALWPATPEVAGCDPVAVAAMAIRSACDDAPYHPDCLSPDGKPYAGRVAFWDKVQGEAERIARWALQGLGITERAITQLGNQAEPTHVERLADQVVRALAKRNITLSDEAIAVIAETAVQSLHIGDAQEWQIQENLCPTGKPAWTDIPATDHDYQACMTRFNGIKSRRPDNVLRIALKRVTIFQPDEASRLAA